MLLAWVLLSACSGHDASPDPSRVIRIAFGIGPTVRASAVNVLTSLLYSEPLIAPGLDGRPGPALAESWTWTEHGRLLTLRLKSGVKFHDGTLMTSAVIADLLNRTRSVPSQVPLGFERITSISTRDAQTLEIRLSKPDSFLLTELNELRVVHPANRDVGTGPFRLVRRQPIVEATRFAEYHGGQPGVDTVEIRTYETNRAAWAALMRGEADAAQEVSRESVEFMEKSSQLWTYSRMQPFYLALVFNQRHPLLRRQEVRQAISRAIDRPAIVAHALRGHAEVATGPIWPSYWAYEPQVRPDAYDPRLAAEMLDHARLGRTAVSADAPRVRFTIRCLFMSEDPQYERIALMLQKQLFDIGVQLDLEPVTMVNLAERAAAGDFDALLARASAGRTLMFTYRFWRSTPGGQPAFWRTGYSGADAALDRLRESNSDDETRAALRQLDERFREDVPAAFLAWTEVTRALNANVRVDDPSLHDPFTAIWRWTKSSGAPPQ